MLLHLHVNLNAAAADDDDDDSILPHSILSIHTFLYLTNACFF